MLDEQIENYVNYKRLKNNGILKAGKQKLYKERENCILSQLNELLKSISGFKKIKSYKYHPNYFDDRYEDSKKYFWRTHYIIIEYMSDMGINKIEFFCYRFDDDCTRIADNYNDSFLVLIYNDITDEDIYDLFLSSVSYVYFKKKKLSFINNSDTVSPQDKIYRQIEAIEYDIINIIKSTTLDETYAFYIRKQKILLILLAKKFDSGSMFAKFPKDIIRKISTMF